MKKKSNRTLAGEFLFQHLSAVEDKRNQKVLAGKIGCVASTLNNYLSETRYMPDERLIAASEYIIKTVEY